MVKNKPQIKYVTYSVLILITLLLPLMIPNEYYRMIFNQTFVYIMAALGLNFITGMTGQPNFGTAGFVAIGAYITGILTTKFNASPWICLIAAILVGYVLGICLGYPSLRIKGIYLALTTTGFNVIVQLLATNMSDVTGGTQGIQNIPSFSIFGFKINENLSNFYFLFFMFLIMLFIAVKIVHSKWGRAFIAIRDNSEAVESCGINIADLKIKAFTLASIYGCVAGVFFATLLGYVSPTTFSLDLAYTFVVMIMLGGIGSMAGTVIGTSVVTILPEVLRFMQDYYWIVFCSIMLIFFMVFPNGLVSIGGRAKALIKEKIGKKKGGHGIADDPSA